MLAQPDLIRPIPKYIKGRAGPPKFIGLPPKFESNSKNLMPKTSPEVDGLGLFWASASSYWVCSGSRLRGAIVRFRGLRSLRNFLIV